MKLSFKVLVLVSSIFVSLLGSTSSASGQGGPVTLNIGDKAPELKVSWIKGTPVNSFDNNMVYVMEFWATWCGPCKAAMPHLSELATQYAGKVTFVGVNVWEKGTENKAYDTALPVIKEFVESMGDKMGYNVAMDNNDRYMSTQWMKAAGQNGIPASFVIKEGKIIWIGHPINLDKTLEGVFAGTYDMNEYKASIEKEKADAASMQATYKELQDKVNNAVQQKDYATALQIIDNALPTINPKLKDYVCSLKFNTLIASDPDKAVAFCEGWKKENPNVVFNLINMIVSKDDYPVQAYQMVINDLDGLMSDPKMESMIPSIHMTKAECYFNMKDKENAVKFAEIALESAQKILASKGESQMVNAKSIESMKTAIAKYKEVK